MSREKKKAAPSPWRSPQGRREERTLGSSAEILERAGVTLAVSKDHGSGRRPRSGWWAYISMKPAYLGGYYRHRDALRHAYTHLREAAFEFGKLLRGYEREYGERAAKTYCKTTVVLEVYTKDELPEGATLDSILAAADESDAVLLDLEWDWYKIPVDWVHSLMIKRGANFKEFDPDYADEEEE